MSICIPLTQGKVALVSDEDADLAEYRWYYYCPYGKSKRGYAGRWGKFGQFGNRAKTFTLHRIIAERMRGSPLFSSERVEHKDGDPLNDQRENLIILTQSEHLLRLRLQQLSRKDS